MKYIKHIILTVFVMVMTGNAWGMDIYIHFSNGTWPTGISSSNFNSDGDFIISDLYPSESIQYLKSKIEDRTGFNPSGMKLSYGTYEDLADNQTLNDYSITQNGTTLTLTYTDPTQPQRVTNNNWRVQTMPRGNRVLRTIWKQACELAFEKDTTVYRGFSFEGQPLTNPHNLDVTYSSSNTNVATVATDGTVTVKGVGDATITASTTGNDDYQACSASYNIQVKEPYKLTLLTVGNGTVDIDGITLPPGVIVDTAHYSGNDKHYLVKPGTGAVDLEATPNLLNYLVNWSNNVTVSNDNPLNAFVMLSDHVTVTATFAPYPILVVEKEGVGDVEVVGVTTFSTKELTADMLPDNIDPVTYILDDIEEIAEDLAKQWTEAPTTGVVKLIYKTSGDYSYVVQYVNGAYSSSNSYIMQQSLVKYEINNQIARYFYTTSLINGTITGPVVDANNNNVYTITPGAKVRLTATAGTNYHFDNWSWGTGSDAQTTNNPIYVTMPNDGTASVTRKANFAVNTYTLTLATDPTNGLQGTLDVVRNNNNELPAGVTGTYPNYTVNEGVNVPLVIAPATHYHLVSLIGGTNQPITYSDNHATIAVVKDTTITATFSIDTYVITATANNSTLGTVSGGGTYNHGVTVTLTATATDSTHFVNWTKEGETNPVSTTSTYNFTAEAAGNYTANFAINPTLKLVADGNGTVNTVGAIAGVTPKNAAAKEYYVAPDTVVTVEATPDNAYYFVNWNSAAARNSNVAVDTVFTMGTDNVILTGHFAKKPVITLVADGHGKVVVDSINNELPAGVVYNNDYNANTGTRSYVVDYGMTLNIVATPDQGYRLLEWENHTSDSVRTVGSIVRDTTFTATFALPTPGLTPEGELTVFGSEFVSETGEIVSRPSITETGEIISNSSQLLSVVISSPYNGLDPVTIYYKSGDTWSQALERPENAGCGIQIVGNQLKKGDYSVYQPVHNLVNPNSEIEADIEYHIGT